MFTSATDTTALTRMSTDAKYCLVLATAIQRDAEKLVNARDDHNIRRLWAEMECALDTLGSHGGWMSQEDARELQKRLERTSDYLAQHLHDMTEVL